MSTRVAILDDYQDVARTLGPWDALGDDVQVTAFEDHVADDDTLVERLAHMRAGGWQHTIGPELSGRTLGIVGLGRLGGRVAAIGHAFAMDVIAWSQNLRAEHASALGVRAVGREGVDCVVGRKRRSALVSGSSSSTDARFLAHCQEVSQISPWLVATRSYRHALRSLAASTLRRDSPERRAGRTALECKGFLAHGH